MTECTDSQLQFEGIGSRRVVADFRAERTTTDGGVLLPREVAERIGFFERIAACFDDHRDPDRIEHSVRELVAQRILGIVCGYEDLNDHDRLRDDPLLALASGKRDPLGQKRERRRDRGHGGAGRSTLNRLELTPEQHDPNERYKKIRYDSDAIEALFVELFQDAHDEPPEMIVLDVDATDDAIHGRQEGRFYHGYYRSYCYLPLYVTCGSFLLASQLNPADIDPAIFAVDELDRIVRQIRQQWPHTEIIIRGDSGFAREDLMTWCESNELHYVLGMSRNDRLVAAIAEELEQVRQETEKTGKPARRFRDFTYRTLKSWSRSRRLVGKAEQLPGKSNPRFVVTSLEPERLGARSLYEGLYCARGDMENRIKESQLDLFADRTSTATMRANQLRLWFSSLAYVLLNEVRRVGLRGTKMQRAQCGTIRTRLLKIGGLVTVSVRRLYVSMSCAFPLQEVFATALANIQAAYPLRC